MIQGTVLQFSEHSILKTLSMYQVTIENLNRLGLELTDYQLENARILIARVNSLLKVWGEDTHVTSGIRDPITQELINPSVKRSAHLIGAAVDLSDQEEKLDNFCLRNQGLLQELGLYLESPLHTPRWCHLQCIPTKSGRTVFIP